MSENDGLFLSEKARELYSRFKFSPEKTAVIVGSLFGDASLLVGRRDRTPNFYENHCIEQLEYIKWKASMLGVPDGIKFRLMTQGYSKGKLVPYFQFRHRGLLDFDRMFYIKKEDGRRKKIVTDEALELLAGSALALAVFYQDDGEYNVYSNQVILNTCDFTMEENQRIAKKLEALLGAPVRIHVKRRRYPRVALSQRGTDQFVSSTTPFVHSSMNYKIDQDITHRFSEELVRKLKEGYGTRLTKDIAAEIDLTPEETRIVANRMGLGRHIRHVRYRDKPFTDEEREYVARNYGKIPTRDIAKRLGTSTGCIGMIARRLRLAGRSRISEEKGEAGESACASRGSEKEPRKTRPRGQ